jgi:tetratricopeptide (TPR) repeat protein
MPASASPPALFPRLERWLSRPGAEASAVLGLFTLAVALRAAHVLSSQASPLFESPQMDALYHVEWARAVAAGREYQDGPYFRAPLYPWFLGAVFALFGQGLLVPRLVQAALGGLSTVLTHRIARRVFDRSTALLAGLLAATHWISIFYDGELLLETLAIPLSLAGLLGALRWLERGRAREGFVAGAFFGLSAICRPNVLLYLPPLLLYALLRRRVAWHAAAALASGALLAILPVTAINLAEGDLVLISYQGGVNLWIGNHPGADGSTAIAPGTRADWWGGFEDTHAQAEAAENRQLAPSEVSRHYARRALAAIAADPGRWLALMLTKLRLFAMNWELGNNEEPYELVRRFSPLLDRLPVGFAALLGLGLLGVVAARGSAKSAPHVALTGFAAVYSLSVVLFFVNARFRLPVLPVLMVYAAHGALWLAARLRARRIWAAGLGGALALGVALTSRALVPAEVPRNSASNGELILAQAALREGDSARALTMLERALEIWPGNLVAVDALAAAGRARFEAGDFEAATRAFARLASARPRSFDAFFSLGRSELAAGRPASAREAFGRALELPEPAEERFLYEAFGRSIELAEGAGEPEQALALARRMQRRFPSDPTVRGVLERLERR